ncbi:MAG: lysophospholipid acyltransferase family protein [Paracoccaceae bacterium]
MSSVWRADDMPEPARIGMTGWLRVLLRGVALAMVIIIGLLLLLMLRLIERPVWGQHRPWSPHITQAVCRLAFIIMGMDHRIQGTRMTERGAVVANHSTWLDIFTLNARKQVYFVSKSDVASWPGIGLLARATGTVFIRRDRRDAKRQKEVFETRLNLGHKLLFFPEGTSTDGTCILPFKSTLFAAFFVPELRDILQIQPVTVKYTAPAGQPDRFYGWWGDMAFAPDLLKILAVRRQGSVLVTYHPALRVSDFADRKALARACENAVRSAF